MRPLPDCATIRQELTRRDVTLMLLWTEYKTQHPDGFQYTQFCAHYRHYAKRLDLSMRQVHRAGKKLFIDYAGQTVAIVDRQSGVCQMAQIFVAVLGASNYTYAEATWTQALPDWIGSHVRTFSHLQALPEIIVPDNLKSGVTSAHRYEPILNATYEDMAAHYGVEILPARVRKPKDKAKVEGTVLLVERWVLARLRHQTFFSLAELNAAIATLLVHLNARAFKKLPGCRRTAFETIDKPAMKPLPTTPYVYAEWKIARVHIDYHVEVSGHYYSVPYALVGIPLDVRLTAHTVEILHRGQRVASHIRSPHKGRHTTETAHMPASHQAYAEWTPQRLVAWAQTAGGAVAEVVATILATRAHPQQGFRSCLGIMRLEKTYGVERLQAAAKRALILKAFSYRSLESILRHGLDRTPLPADDTPAQVIDHDNVRGSDYFH